MSRGGSSYPSSYGTGLGDEADDAQGDHTDGQNVLVDVSKANQMDTDVMSQSSWKVHLSLLIKGAIGMAESLSLGHGVLVHCSDGWDRTAQLSSLSQVLLDPHYRTSLSYNYCLYCCWNIPYLVAH